MRVRSLVIVMGLGSMTAAGAGSAELDPIDPICPGVILGECVSVPIDPGIYLRERKSSGWHAVEVGYSSNLFACSAGEKPERPPGCIDVDEITRITPNLDLPKY